MSPATAAVMVPPSLRSSATACRLHQRRAKRRSHCADADIIIGHAAYAPPVAEAVVPSVSAQRAQFAA